MSLIKLLSKKFDRTLFTTPTHGQKSAFLPNLDCFYNWDFSEIEGFDNLADPKGAILMAQGKASDIYNTQKTFFLTQGSTTGILAIMKTLLRPNDKVLVARNCHKAVYNGLVLTQAHVDWIMPETDGVITQKYGVMGPVVPQSVENLLKLNSYKALIITSPTYDGVNSDIAEISRICKQYGTYLIVDEAHGALYNFSEFFAQTAIAQGADFSVNSLHKNAGALNQCALLHMSKDVIGVEWRQLQKCLNLFQTTSPSYPLIACIEACINFLNSPSGEKAIDSLVLNVLEFQKTAKNLGFEFLNLECADPTKMLMKYENVPATTISELLLNEYNIEDEMANELSVLFLTGIGTTKQKLDKLKNALYKIVEKNIKGLIKNEPIFASVQPFPLVKMQPCEVFNLDYSFVKKEDSLLLTTSEMLIPYPPGIGILYPGEAIQEWHIDYLNDYVGVIK